MLKRVPPEGPIDAKLVIIGEAPGADEEALGRPFVGTSGKLLSGLLASAGINRLECYITNVVKYRPPDNKINRLEEIGITMEQSIKELKEELSLLNPNVILALGNIPLQVLTGKESITKWRGSILESTLLPRKKVIPTFHPAACLHGAIQDTFFIGADASKAKRESEFPDFRSLSKRNFIVNPSYEQILSALQEIKTWTFVTVDIENLIGENILAFDEVPVITEVGLGDSACPEKGGNFTITIPFFKGGLPVWTPEQEIAIWKEIKSILSNPKIYKIAQNASHELTHLYPYVGEIYPLFMDTMVGSHLAYPEIEKSLEVISSLYTNEPYWKDNKSALDYNAKDVAVTHEAAMYIDKEELAPINLTHFLHGFQMPLYNIMWRATMKGIRIDNERRMYYYLEAEKDLEQYRKSLNAIVGYDINADSPKQIQQLLYNELKLVPQRKGGKITSDEEAIKKLDHKYKLPVLKLILQVREKSKALSTYLNSKSQDHDGRIRSRWVVTGTETGRLASKRNTWGTGCNLQNIPKVIRDIFIPDEGYIFVIGDMSQVEARFVAWLSGDLTYKNMFKSGKDIHKQVAGWIFRKDPMLVSKEERQKGKATAHGTPYGMTYKKVAALYNLSEGEAKFLMEQFHIMFPLVRSEYQEGIKKSLGKNRTLFNAYGRRRIFLGWWGEELFRQAYASNPQGSAADHINTAAVRIHHRFRPEWDACILLQIHDELVIQVKKEYANDVARIFKEEVERPIMVNNDLMTIPLDLRIGTTWAEKDGKAWEGNEGI